MAVERVEIYDTTLRDGTQAEGLNLSVDDKLRVAQRLDALGVPYLEGGWPGSNPRDREFFARAAELDLSSARLVGFCSTHHPKNTPAGDPNLQGLLESGVGIAAMVGKSWTLPLSAQLGITAERNLEMIRGSVAYLVEKGIEVFFDAEHFLDAWRHEPDYAFQVCAAAAEGGASALILCDTSGGALPEEAARCTADVVQRFGGLTVGIHCHNDAGLAVASSLAAVSAGATQVQGTISGFGERCGNADLCAIIPNLQLKMGITCLPPDRLQRLTETARVLYELANLPPNRYAPYVGASAFSHKGGMHINAVKKDPTIYEHIDPELVGNSRKMVVSDLSGRSTVLAKAKAWGIDLSADDPGTQEILQILKDRENYGYLYEGAEASFELLMNRALGQTRHYFELVGFRVMDYKAAEHDEPQSEATVRVRVGDAEEHTAATGHGPVHALDRALRKALLHFFPQLEQVRLVDYKVRVLAPKEGTAARVRVLIYSSDGQATWGTVGVSFDVLEASWQALGDSIRYKLFKEEQAANPA